MIFSARISTKQMAQFCRRFGTAIEAGLDVRRILERERKLSSSTYQSKMSRIQQAVSNGQTLAGAIQAQGNYFPRQFCQMVEVGEKTGRLDLVFLKSAEYYEQLQRMKGIFLVAIAWPAIQLGIALGVVGLLIWITGWIGSLANGSQTTDLLGFGLVGTKGLIIYIAILNAIALGVIIFISAVRRGFLLPQISELVMRIPGIGPALRLMAQLRFARTLGLGIDSGVDAVHSVGLAFKSTQSEFFQKHSAGVAKAIRNGEEMHSALREPDVFSTELLDAIQIGEETGKLAESMETHASQLDDRVKVAVRSIAFACGLAVWVLVGTFIIFLIFRLASFYLGVLTDVMNGF